MWVTVSVTETASGEAVGDIFLSESLHGISGGEGVAVLLTLEVSEGWRMEKIEEASHAPEMRVTAELWDGNRRAAVLLDGYPREEAGDLPLLTVTLARAGEGDLPCRLTVGPGRYGEEAVYYRDGSGGIRTRPLRFAAPPLWDTTAEEEASACPDSPPREETEGGSMQETPTEPAEERETGQDPEGTPLEEEPSEEPDEGEREPSVCFIGCRETPVRDGRFAVQLLFRGEWAYTPAVCFSGGSGVLLEVTEVDGREIMGGEVPYEWENDRLYACTFGGLSAEGEVLFFVETPGGIVRVIYRNGIFWEYRMENSKKYR